MAEDEVQDQETGTPEPSDEDVWDNVVEEDADGNPLEAEDETEQETEAEEEPVAEDVADVEETDEEESEEEPQHDFEKRYKDLEREFHKRNESSKELKEEFDDLRLQVLEREKELEELKKQAEQVKKEPDQPDPNDPEILDNFFNEDDKETMEEFGELTKTFRKVVQHELAKAKKPEEADDQVKRIEQLESAAQQYMYEKFVAEHEKAMTENVGSFYTELDRDADFQRFVLDSPAMTQMMTKSTAAKDHASVMNLYLAQPGMRELWDSSSKDTKSAPSAKQQQRRVAATGAVKNSAPRMEKNTDNMTDEDLWNSIEEQEAEFS